MRVITGSARGRRLKSPEGYDIRPTTDKVKEAIFSAIQFDLPGATVADLFAGSGQMGIEALSRGANFCVFSDSGKSAIDVVTENIAATGFIDKSRVFYGDCISMLSTAKEKFDVVIIDPPYGKGLVLKALEALKDKMSDRGVIVCEHETGLELPRNVGNLSIKKEKNYGKVVAVTIYSAE